MDPPSTIPEVTKLVQDMLSESHSVLYQYQLTGDQMSEAISNLTRLYEALERGVFEK